ncbi:MAG: hypothetical protein Q4E13_12160 [Clostridia bacterium]|nr:hypothetical protein [Clostridia bacterium]
MGNRIYRTLEEINGAAPGTLICQEEGGYRLRFYSTQGNELAHTDVYDDKDQCIDVYWRIYAIFRQQRVKNRFAR